MKINLDFSLFEFNYTAPITVLNRTLNHNRALSVAISTEETLIGKIDLTPLPHFHHYTLEEWQYTLDQFFSEAEISLEQIVLEAPYFNMIKNPSSLYKNSGELLFIIESILFAVIEKVSPQSLSLISNKEIKLNALYSSGLGPGSLSEALAECLKIKIRPTKECLEETKNLIKNLLATAPGIRLRLDGNRSFELEELLFFMSELENFCGSNFNQSIEYLEEPFKNQYDYLAFSKVYPYPQALDESLLCLIADLDYLLRLPANTHLVLKPSLLGISKSFAIMLLAAQRGHNVVISSSYETKSAIRPLLFLAANNPFTYHGLDTLKFLPKELGIKTANFSLSL